MYIPLKPLFSRHKGIGVQFTDEPTGALDARNSEKLMEMLADVNEKLKATILMVTHDPFSVVYCNHIFFLKNGKISYELYKGSRNKEEYLAAILDAQKN